MEAPRDSLQHYLAEQQVTPVDFARRAEIPFEVVHAVCEGEYPKDPKALHELGLRIGIDRLEWSRRLAAGLTKLSGEDAQETLPGLLWAHLIAEGMSVDDAAARYQASPLAIWYALSNGHAGPALRKGGLLEALNIPEGHPLRENGPPSGKDKALGEMLTTAMRARHLTIEGLSTAIGMDEAGIRNLLQGQVSPRLKPFFVPALAKELHLDLHDLASRLAKTYRTISDCTGTLKYLISRYLLKHGVYLVAFAKQAGVSIDVVKGIYGDHIPEGKNLSCIVTALKATKEEIDLAVRNQTQRRLAESASYRSLGNDVKAINVLITEAADTEGLKVYEWGKKHHIGSERLQRILYRGAVPRRQEIRSPLMKALGLDRGQYDLACRKMAEEVRPRESGLDRIKPVTGVQEALIRLVKQGVTIRDLARGCGVSSRQMEGYLRNGIFTSKQVTQERIRKYLRFDLRTFTRMLEPLGEDEGIEKDDEMRLLAAYRKLSEMDQYRMREIAGRMLAKRRFDTLARG